MTKRAGKLSNIWIRWVWVARKKLRTFLANGKFRVFSSLWCISQALTLSHTLSLSLYLRHACNTWSLFLQKFLEERKTLQHGIHGKLTCVDTQINCYVNFPTNGHVQSVIAQIRKKQKNKENTRVQRDFSNILKGVDGDGVAGDRKAFVDQCVFKNR